MRPRVKGTHIGVTLNRIIVRPFRMLVLPHYLQSPGQKFRRSVIRHLRMRMPKTLGKDQEAIPGGQRSDLSLGLAP